MIAYSDIASKIEKLQGSIDEWFDENGNLAGNTILINGKLGSKTKYSSV